MTFYVELCAELPPAVSRLMSVPTVGPKTAWRLNEELGITNAAELKAAAESGKIRALYGFGEKRERHLLDGAIAVLNGNPKIYAPLPPEDAVFGWDYPALRDMLQARGMPHVCLRSDQDQALTPDEHARLEVMVSAASTLQEARHG